MTENQECEHIWSCEFYAVALNKNNLIRCKKCVMQFSTLNDFLQFVTLAENKRVISYVEKLAKDYINPYYKSPFTFLEKLASLRLKEDEKK